MAGTLTATTIQNDTSSPPTFRNNSVEIGRLCRAWVNFDGVNSITINSSFNVSSVTRNSTGDYTVNMTTAMPNTNYAVLGMAANSNGAQANVPSLKYGNGTQNGGTSPTLKSTTQVTFVVGIGNNTSAFDSYGINISVFSS